MPSAPGYIPGPFVIPGIVDVVLKWSLADGTVATNHIKCQNSLPQVINAALCDVVYAAITGAPEWTAYAARLSDQTSLLAVLMRNLDLANQPLVSSAAAAAPGTNAAHPMPEGVALVASILTETAGRGGRGRLYLCGFSVDQVDTTGRAVAGLVTDATAFTRAVQAILGGQSLLPQVATKGHALYTSPNTGLPVPATAAGSVQASDIVVRDNKFDSQRRRI